MRPADVTGAALEISRIEAGDSEAHGWGSAWHLASHWRLEESNGTVADAFSGCAIHTARPSPAHVTVQSPRPRSSSEARQVVQINYVHPKARNIRRNVGTISSSSSHHTKYIKNWYFPARVSKFGNAGWDVGGSASRMVGTCTAIARRRRFRRLEAATPATRPKRPFRWPDC